MKHHLINQRETTQGSEVRPNEVELWKDRKSAPNVWVKEHHIYREGETEMWHIEEMNKWIFH